MTLVMSNSEIQLTPVLGAQPQHQSHREDLCPWRLPLLQQDAEDVGWLWQQKFLQTLKSGADVQEATVVATVQEALGKDGVAQVGYRVTCLRNIHIVCILDSYSPLQYLVMLF